MDRREIDRDRGGITFYDDIAKEIMKEVGVSELAIRGMYEFTLAEMKRMATLTDAIGFRVPHFGLMYIRKYSVRTLLKRAVDVGNTAQVLSYLHKAVLIDDCVEMVRNLEGNKRRILPRHVKKQRYFYRTFNHGFSLADLTEKQNLESGFKDLKLNV